MGPMQVISPRSCWYSVLILRTLIVGHLARGRFGGQRSMRDNTLLI